VVKAKIISLMLIACSLFILINLALLLVFGTYFIYEPNRFMLWLEIIIALFALVMGIIGFNEKEE